MPSRRREPGVTLPELLVVIAIIGLAVAVSIPLVTDAVRASRIRVAANQFTVTLKAVRMIAVSTQSPVDLVIHASPANAYEYTDIAGRPKRFEMPPGVRITSADSTIAFRPNGSVTAQSATRFEVELTRGKTEVWNVGTSMLGVSIVTHSVEP